MQTLTLDVPSSVAAGTSLDVTDLRGPKTVFINVGVMTTQIQISANGTNWHNEGTAITNTGTLHITKPCNFIRANVTAYTSGVAAGQVVIDLHG